MYPGLESVPPKTSPRKSSDLVTVNGCDKLGELLTHACEEAIDDEDALGLSAVGTAAKLIMVSSFLSLSCLVPSSDMESPTVASSAEAANALLTTHCATRYAYSRRSHVVLTSSSKQTL